jgi:glutaredoxin
MPACPYCQKVFRYLDSQGIKIELKDTVGSPENKKELLLIGGKKQVPCLAIDGEALYESDTIIQWLKENWKS